MVDTQGCILLQSAGSSSENQAGDIAKNLAGETSVTACGAGELAMKQEAQRGQS